MLICPDVGLGKTFIKLLFSFELKPTGHVTFNVTVFVVSKQILSCNKQRKSWLSLLNVTDLIVRLLVVAPENCPLFDTSLKPSPKFICH